MKWLLQFIPGSFLSAVTPFLNPWVWVALLSASTGAFLYATYLAHLRFEAYEQSVAAVGNAQKVIVRFIVRQQTVVDQEAVNALNRDKARLARDNAVLLASLHEHARRSVLPPNSPPTPGDQGGVGSTIPTGYLCFDRDKLDGGLREARERAVGGYLKSFERGARALIALNACVSWAEKQHSLNPTGELMPEAP